MLCLPPEDAARKLGVGGKPYRLVDVALGTRTGESRRQTTGSSVRGPNVFPGYWRNPEATAAVLRGRLALTGDIAEVDAEGCYRIAVA